MSESTLERYPNLLAWRKAKGMTQEMAAQHLGIWQARYSQIERGLPMRRTSAEPIAEATGVPIDVLVGVAS